MDVSIVIVTFLILACGQTLQMPQENIEAENTESVTTTTEGIETTTQEIDSETTDIPAPTNCTTGRNVPGSCVKRDQCNFSTTAIDFTLYAPKGYAKICKVAEVCCPFEYLLPEQPKFEVSLDDSAFNFDDDD